ncbi:pancreatic lipase-related protein 2-like [Diorhabda sublineata]|uniref:pancreatic lipase-related protein 2-like n=1 Tax=Diorhabda sublineata TaxID=1163346 RepID=UPI0024E14073|nr:pancreatic lipase-related protein 2-like [Diorhabda sublineata]
MGLLSHFSLLCFIGSLPGPPGVSIEDAYVQLFPIDKGKCHGIDPVLDITFQLFTRYNPLQPSSLRIDDEESLRKSHFNFSEPTVIFFHAFFESYQSTPGRLIRTAFLQRKDYNVLFVDAQRLEAGPWYLTAAKNTMVVGKYTAKFVDYLVSKGLHLPSLHLTGLSLGAQMAGVCAQTVKSGRIRRITGMDPAGPLFAKWPNDVKLDAGDADFVDVIHSDAGIFGYPTSVGHVDFWPNRGIAPQPGCTVKEIEARNPGSLIEPLFCSHWRSYQFFAESVINPDAFRDATPCPTWENYIRGECNNFEYGPTTSMGLYVDFEARGDYFLKTNRESPFSKT